MIHSLNLLQRDCAKEGVDILQKKNEIKNQLTEREYVYKYKCVFYMIDRERYRV